MPYWYSAITDLLRVVFWLGSAWIAGMLLIRGLDLFLWNKKEQKRRSESLEFLANKSASALQVVGTKGHDDETIARESASAQLTDISKDLRAIGQGIEDLRRLLIPHKAPDTDSSEIVTLEQAVAHAEWGQTALKYIEWLIRVSEELNDLSTDPAAGQPQYFKFFEGHLRDFSELLTVSPEDCVNKWTEKRVQDEFVSLWNKVREKANEMGLETIPVVAESDRVDESSGKWQVHHSEPTAIHESGVIKEQKEPGFWFLKGRYILRPATVVTWRHDPSAAESITNQQSGGKMDPNLPGTPAQVALDQALRDVESRLAGGQGSEELKMFMDWPRTVLEAARRVTQAKCVTTADKESFCRRFVDTDKWAETLFVNSGSVEERVGALPNDVQKDGRRLYNAVRNVCDEAGSQLKNWGLTLIEPNRGDWFALDLHEKLLEEVPAYNWTQDQNTIAEPVRIGFQFQFGEARETIRRAQVKVFKSKR